MLKKESQKRLLFVLLLILLPIIIGFIFGLFVKIPTLYIISAIYALMLIFMIPSDVFSRSSLDYTIKAVNPTYKHELPKISGIENKNQLIDFLIVAVMFAICLLIVFLTTS